MTQRIATALTRSLATGMALVLLPGMAWAQGETLVTYTGDPDSGASISVRAAAGEANGLVASARGAGLSFRDTSAGIIAPDSPHCVQAGPNEVRCRATGPKALAIDSGDKADRVRLGFTVDSRPEIDRITVDTGSGNDVARVELDRHSDISSKLQVVSRGGSGDDRLSIQVGTSDLQNAENIVDGGSGDDRVRLSGTGIVKGQAGNDRLVGREGDQRIFGGRGMDRLAAGEGDDDYCNGGAENDSGGAGCETIVSL